MLKLIGLMLRPSFLMILAMLAIALVSLVLRVVSSVMTTLADRRR